MAYNYDNSSGGGGDNNDLISWIIVVAALIFFWPVGLVLLFLKLTGRSFVGGNRSDSQRSRHPYDIQQDRAAGAGPYRAQNGQSGPKSAGAAGYSAAPGRDSARTAQRAQRYEYRYESQPASGAARTPPRQPGTQGVPYQKRRKPVDLNKGKGMTIWGGILTGVFGFSAISALPIALMEEGFFTAMAMMAPLMGFLGAGLVLLYCGVQRGKKAKRFRKYLTLIGKRESISISSLAQAMPVSIHTACDDLQEMLDEGYIPTGYLDMGSGRLILSDEGLRDPEPEAAPEPEPEVEEEQVDDDTILQEIKMVNDAIADPVMSQKIDRIGEITGKILDYQRKNPNKNSQLRSFLSYYLPTTLKILKAYAQMEAQGIEGENISAAKIRIEGMMDKVVEGFEKQLDKLFQDDAMDITTDVEVLERMLDKDGLSGGGEGFQMGC